jgi:excisionase family DNA binding protein
MSQELTPSQAATRLGATTRSVQRWIASGRLPARRVGGRWRVASDALDAFMRAGEAAGGAGTTSAVAARAIRRVFVANRGEIAARIRWTTDRLGMTAITPATDGPGALDLLDARAVVEAARQAGVDALHPGFGFLAESADFAALVEAAGIRWVGPPPHAIRAMGDKAAARKLAAQLGVAILPGYDGEDQSGDALAAAAARIGYPVLVKPAAGGGGKGMRVVGNAASLADAVAGARREAAAAFGDDRLILERFLEGPRHVEVQVLFDAHGAGVHLGERDCSIQRRHQKILEETPSPAVTPALRARLGEAALTLAHAVGYVSAGTCEFLVDDRGEPVFLEMNTRLQVEHPVTELVTGRDLVADQLRIAAGEPLGFGQDDVRTDGHAVEVRLYAEDADAGFLPATGRIERLHWPAGEGIRVDAGVAVGDEVTGRFDPMLAKVIAHGRDRAEAFDRLAAALDATVVLGLVTNLRFLRWLVRQPVVRDGEARIDTRAAIWPPPDDASEAGDEAAASAGVRDVTWAAAARVLAGSPGSRQDDPWSGGWRLAGPATLRLVAEGEERTVPVPAGVAEDPAFVRAGDTVHVDEDGRSIAVGLAPPPDVDRAARAAAAALAHGGGTLELTAPMPGAVVRVHADVGSEVQAGDPIVTLEAMKMEHAVTSPIDGRLADLTVQPGDQVGRGQHLGTVEP